MSDTSVSVLAVAGSAGQKSSTSAVLHHLTGLLQKGGATVDVLDLGKTPLPSFDPTISYQADYYPALKSRVEAADVLLLATPDYHGSISSTLKNFLDHFWKEYAGKLFATIVGSYEKGLTVTDQLRTVARQCNAWTLPYGVAFMDRQDVVEGQVAGDTLPLRLEMLARDVRVYGALLAGQRRADLESDDTGFMTRYRIKS
jgi:FMN reductase